MLLLALACAAPPPPEPPGPVEPPRHAAPPPVILGEPAIAAIAELLRMEDRRTVDSVRIAGLLAHPEAQVRGRAALAAGRIADRRMTPLLIGALADSAPYVRAGAALALGELGDTSTAVVRALADAAAGAAPGDTAAAEAIAALGRLASASGRSALLDILTPAPLPDGDSARNASDAGAAPLHINEALLAIWQLPRTAEAVRAAEAHLDAFDVETRWRAAFALMRMAEPSSAARLVQLLEGDDDALVRSLAARALRAPIVDSAGIRATAVPALRAALRDPHAHVRINALGALATYRDTAYATDVAAMLFDRDRNIGIAAAQALGQLGGAGVIAPLEATAADTAAPLALRAAAVGSLVRLDTARAVGVAAGWVGAGDWLARLYAARSLAGAPWARTAQHLRTLAQDDDPRVAAAALAAITNAADSTANLRPIYIEALGSFDVGVRAAATRGIARRAGPADLDVLLQAYERAQRDTENDAALAAIDGLGVLARNEMPVARTFFLRFARSNDPVVRRRVAQRLGPDGWGDDRPAASDRPLDFYLGVARDLVAAELAGVPRPRAVIRTRRGAITLELFGADAPLTVHNLMTLAAGGYFRAAPEPGSPTHRWHRVVPNFVLQDGDPRGDGSGGPGYAIRDEINRHRYLRGALGMALSGPDTGGSQFFITHSPQPHLDGGYTVFGRVIDGMDVADAVVQDDPILSIEVRR